MRAEYDAYFSAMARLKKKDLSSQERLALLAQLKRRLLDWGTYVFHEKSFEWFQVYEAHGHLPFAGAWEDQPRYVQLELLHWTRLQRWHELNEELPSVEGLPTMGQLT